MSLAALSVPQYVVEHGHDEGAKGGCTIRVVDRAVNTRDVFHRVFECVSVFIFVHFGARISIITVSCAGGNILLFNLRDIMDY